MLIFFLRYSGGGSAKNLRLNRGIPSLRWMADEAGKAGVILMTSSFESATLHKLANHFDGSSSMTGIWWVLEGLPFRRLSYRGREGITWK